MSLGERRPPDNDPPTARSLRDGWQVHPFGRGKISDDSSSKEWTVPLAVSAMWNLSKPNEGQVESVLDILGLLVRPFELGRIEPERRIRGCVPKLTWVTSGSKKRACERRF